MFGFRLKKEIIFLCTMEKHGLEKMKWHTAVSLLVPQSLLSVVGRGDLAISRRIKLETGGAVVPKTQK